MKGRRKMAAWNNRYMDGAKLSPTFIRDAASRNDWLWIPTETGRGSEFNFGHLASFSSASGNWLILRPGRISSRAVPRLSRQPR
jgi:hypothetical protein